VLSIVDLAEKQLSGNQARRETLVSCSGNTRTTLVVLNQDQPIVSMTVQRSSTTWLLVREP
jgi:hypothetical protein